MIADHILPPDTQAILLLCGSFGGNGSRGIKPLSLSEYNTLAVRLRREGLRPSVLLEGEAGKEVEQICSGKVDPERLHALLGRGVEMGFAVEEWARQGIWVLSRGDGSYPRALKSRLREKAPPLLFGVGNRDLLEGDGLGMVGSRNADEVALRFTRDVARRCAEEQLNVVSGGAKGVDREAMSAALSAGGSVLGILPEGVAKVAVSKANREPIAEGRLTLVSPYHPHARWTRGNAMGRNKHIYAFSDWTLVVSSATEGGTWNGAVESVRKGWGRLLVRASADAPEGNAKLIGLGGIPLAPDALERAESLHTLLIGLFPSNRIAGDRAPTLFSAIEASSAARTEDTPPSVTEPARDAEAEILASSDGDGLDGSPPPPVKQQTVEPTIGDLFDAVWPSVALAFVEERADKDLTDVAVSFNVQVGQLKAWVKQAVEEGYLEKRTRPVCYTIKPAQIESHTVRVI